MNPRRTLSYIKVSIATFFATFLLATIPGINHADDTEIFFNNGGALVRPNILLILDTSSSMNQAVTSPNIANPPTRIAVLKEAVRDIINGIIDVNIGLMRFTASEGGPVLFPVAPIDAPVSDYPSEDSSAFSNVITDSSNDSQEELTANTVDTDATALSVGNIIIPAERFDSGSSTERLKTSATESVQFGSTFLNGDFNFHSNDHSAMQFEETRVPRNADITLAQLDLYIRKTGGGATTMQVCAEDDDNPAMLQFRIRNISSRLPNCTTATIDRDIPSYSSSSDIPKKITLDVSPIIEELVQRGCTNPGVTTDRSGCTFGTGGSTGGEIGDKIIFLFDNISGAGNRQICGRTSKNPCRNNTRPRLRIEWAGAVNHVQAADVVVQNSVAIRFDGVRIPQGAIVDAANLVFTPYNDQAITTNIVIAANDADNSAELLATNGDISNRTLTTATARWDNVPAWTAGATETTPDSIDFRSVVQEIVDRGGWCGGNAMTFILSSNVGLRNFISADQAVAQAVQFNYSYEPATATGCGTTTDTIGVSVAADDAEEDGSTVELQGPLDFKRNNTVGIRFQDINVAQGASIESAILTFQADRPHVNAVTIDIKGELAAGSARFAAVDQDIQGRDLTTASVTWQPEAWLELNTYDSDDVSAIVQEIVDQPNWTPGNPLSFIFTTQNGERIAESNDSRPSARPKLTLRYQTSSIPIKTVRDRLLELVAELPSQDNGTPVVKAMHEAARYWAGGQVNYGKNRLSPTARLSHPGSYCTAAGACRGADENNGAIPTDAFGVYSPPNCEDLDSSFCTNRRIQGTPSYITPFTSASTCQRNFQVLLTDGQANSSDIAVRQNIRAEFLNGAACKTTDGDGDKYDNNEKCAVDLAGALFTEDQNASLENDQSVTTYTIAFNLDDAGPRQFLEDVAIAGSGSADGFYRANTVSELLSVFQRIFAEVVDDPTSFVAPAIATNQFNNLESRDTAYFSMFTPSLETRWFGNVKRYNLCLQPEDSDGDGVNDCKFADVLDATGANAVDPATGQFRDDARSVWTAGAPDGTETLKGGAGALLNNYTTRTLYTEATATGIAPPADTNLADTSGNFIITADNWDDADLAHVRNLVCPSPSTAANSNCANRMLWMLGKISDPNSMTDPSATTHWSIFDVLHSTPVPVTYGGADSDQNGIFDTFFDKVFFGTNGGALHMLNAETGEEEWAFIPEALLELQATLFDNTQGSHQYGLDLPATIRLFDQNRDGIIDPATDFVHLYIGNRRGGNFYYALDITPNIAMTDAAKATAAVIQPKFLWRIQGGVGDFARMGDSWSQPKLANIRTTTGSKTVLIFGAGYDNIMDTRFSDSDVQGNGLFIVDAADGSLLLDITGTAGADIVSPEMNFSVPAPVTVFDSDGDGFQDRLYFSDTGGQVFRVDLGLDIRENGGLDTNVAIGSRTVVGRLANISTAGAPPPGGLSQERRFYIEPVVVQVTDTQFSDAANGKFDYVFIGSGAVPNPLGTHVNDRFYGFRDRTTSRMSDANGDHLAEGYPARSAALTPSASATSEPIDHSNPGDLVDITKTALNSNNLTHVRSSGWYYDFAEEPKPVAGEKVIRRPRVAGGILTFPTFQPNAGMPEDMCDANIGQTRRFSLNILSTAAPNAVDADGDGNPDSTGDRHTIGGQGIGSGDVVVHGEEGGQNLETTGAGIGSRKTVPGKPRFRTYWHDDI